MLRNRLAVGVCASLLLLTNVTYAAADNFGAIAFSKSNGAWGYSYDYGSRRAAEREAMRNCRQHGRGCEVVLWFRNACGALYTGTGLGWGVGWAASRQEAERIARRYCRQYTNNCRMAAWACTTR